ncbi:phosphotransferase [Pantoea coffeiphila]|uniref:Phosphotransferase n=1 Tax=Pantoea coffeiphila TaxID=1465635 RepID=A0A2S9I8Q9_9GAMM|nr:phosphotransferase [Pantoea coffeiphila]
MLGAGCWVLGAGCWVLGAGCWVLERLPVSVRKGR